MTHDIDNAEQETKKPRVQQTPGQFRNGGLIETTSFYRKHA